MLKNDFLIVPNKHTRAIKVNHWNSQNIAEGVAVTSVLVCVSPPMRYGHSECNSKIHRYVHTRTQIHGSFSVSGDSWKYLVKSPKLYTAFA